LRDAYALANEFHAAAGPIDPASHILAVSRASFSRLDEATRKEDN
jgi:hypothetical protein